MKKLGGIRQTVGLGTVSILATSIVVLGVEWSEWSMADPAQARIEAEVSTLKQEPMLRSVEKLIDAHAFLWPGPPPLDIVQSAGLPLGPESDHRTIETILSSRRFRKVLAELGQLDRRTVSIIVAGQLSNAVSKYLPLYAKKMDEVSRLGTNGSLYHAPFSSYTEFPHHDLNLHVDEGATNLPDSAVRALAKLPEFKDLPAAVLTNLGKLAVLHFSDVTNSGDISVINGQIVVLQGVRLQVLSLVWLSGLLELDELKPQVGRITGIAVRQREELYAANSLDPLARERMLTLGSLYNRQILGYALLRVSEKSPEIAVAFEKSKLELQSRDLVGFAAAVTEYDLPVRSGLMRPDFASGKITVSYLSRATDTVFDTLSGTLIALP